MKLLALFRHAKTERQSATGRDFGRLLAERGRGDAVRMGEAIRSLGHGFDQIVTSPAARAVQTAELAGLAARQDGRIYEASAGDLLAIVQATDDAAGSLMMIGHNPGFEQLASLLAGETVMMPTGSLVEIALPVHRWADAGSRGRLVRFLSPGALG